jgi:hypothetical protein
VLLAALSATVLTAVSASARTAVVTGGSQDVVVTGSGDANGYHLFGARAADGWQWRPLATIAPAGFDGVMWTGQQCLTGDGRFAVVAMAPTLTLNDQRIADAGALSYAVGVSDGSVRPLLRGVAMRYFTPGCGLDSRVVLTRYQGEQSRTQLVELDAATGRTQRQRTLRGEVTNAVPLGSDILAVRGRAIVRIDSSGAEQTLTTPAQAPLRLRPNGTAGVDFLTVDGDVTTAWRMGADHRAAVLGTGPTGQVGLFAGRGGRSTVVAGRRAAGASLDGQVLLAAGASADSVLTDANTGQVLAGSLPTPARGTGTAQARTRIPAAAPAAGTPNQTSPTCAVPRNDPHLQVPQPSGPQINWAVQQAVRNSLTASGGLRPAGYLNLGQAAYSPSADFAVPALHAPPGGATTIPPQVVNGILAQESNWDQASFHAPRGAPGNPLIADYFGIMATGGVIDFDRADCGYGIGQLTDFMTKASTAVSQDVKVRVAEDYAENVSAAAGVLAGKWNQLFDLGITIGTADPATLENWYFAMWAYNSGIHPSDGAGNSGLGWANNPANPVYPADRQAFLSSPSDATHPQDWPYQEKVFGWMEKPLHDQISGAGLYASAVSGGGLLARPANTTAFCSLTQNSCDPGSVASPCTRSDLHCWWHAPAGSFPGTQHGGFFDVAAGAPEPSAANPFPPVCVPDSGMGPGTLIVTTNPDPAANLNLVGCAIRHSDGAFAVDFGGSSAPYPPASIDWHQLGGGFDGRFFFTHTNLAGDTVNTIAGTWTSPALGGSYDIRVFVPSFGASTTNAVYHVKTSATAQDILSPVNQNQFSNQWISLGTFQLQSNASVSVSSATTDGTSGADLAYDAMAFVPA